MQKTLWGVESTGIPDDDSDGNRQIEVNLKAKGGHMGVWNVRMGDGRHVYIGQVLLKNGGKETHPALGPTVGTRFCETQHKSVRGCVVLGEEDG